MNKVQIIDIGYLQLLNKERTGKKLTLKEIAEKTGYTIERISTIKKTPISKSTLLIKWLIEEKGFTINEIIREKR